MDCADRERTEWMDDSPPAFDITRTAMASPGLAGRKVYADARLLGEMLRRTALTVQPEGWVKAHTCSDRFDIHAKMEDRACDWVEGARLFYESTGDPAIIREIWPVIVRQMKYFLDRRTSRGLVLAREWEVWGNPIGYATCEGAGLNAFIYKSLVDAAYLGRAIGQNSQADDFERAAKDLATAFDKVLWNEEEGTYNSGYTDDLEKAKGPSKIEVPLNGSFFAPTVFPALFALDQDIVPAVKRARRAVSAGQPAEVQQSHDVLLPLQAVVRVGRPEDRRRSAAKHAYEVAGDARLAVANDLGSIQRWVQGPHLWDVSGIFSEHPGTGSQAGSAGLRENHRHRTAPRRPDPSRGQRDH